MANQTYADNAGTAVGMARNWGQEAKKHFVLSKPIMGIRRKGTNAGLLFMFSPSEVTSTHRAKYSAPKAAGKKDINEQFARTEAQAWSFSLFLNDYGNYAERSSGGGGRAFLSVEETIALLISYTEPIKVSAKVEGSAKTGFPEQPPILEFFTGFTKVTCTLRELEIKRTMFHPRTGRTMRATVEITLKQQIDPNSPVAKTARTLANRFRQGLISGTKAARGNYAGAVGTALKSFSVRR